MIVAIALDLGSTSVKAGLLDQQGNLSGIVSLPAPAIHPDEGRYESDALAYAVIAEQVLKDCLAQTDTFPPLGLCSQRSSFLLWEKSSGKPVTPLISWQDTRGAGSCVELHSQESLINELTGLRLTPYYFAPKFRIVLQENPEWRERLLRGELLVGTLDTFLIWRWTGGKHYITDASMAARTLLMDINHQQWSQTLCELFSIPLSILPAIKTSTSLNVKLDNGLTLQASLGDQSAALVASVGDARDVALVNLGTGGFVIRYLVDPYANTDGYLRTLVYQGSSLTAHIAIEGTINSIAAAIAPYTVSDCSIDDLATHADIFCIAEPSGLGAPYFRQDIGLQFSASIEKLMQKQIASLVLEAIVFRVARIVEDFHHDAPIKQVYLSGGLSELTCLQKGIAMCLHCDVYRLLQRESSLQGAGMLANGVMTGYRQGATKVIRLNKNNAIFNKYLRWKLWFDGILDA
jgi:glycerol kinase